MRRAGGLAKLAGWAAVAGSFLIAVLVGGCGSADRMQKPIAAFRTATADLTGVARPYLMELNQVERHQVFVDAAADPTQSLDEKIIKPVFAPEGIRARLEALAIIDSYAQRLATIAGSDASAQLRTNAKALSENLT